MAAQVSQLRDCEAAREKHFSAHGLGDASFRINPRQIRSWNDLREKWLRSKDRSEAALIEIVAAEQGRLRGKFGDPDLFRWLAKEANHALWDGGTDPVYTTATLNAMQSLVERSKGTATMTLPDPIHHPRGVLWEPPAGFLPQTLLSRH